MSLEDLMPMLREHSGELLILTMTLLILTTLLISLPQLLRANMRRAELIHEQRLKSLDKGIPLPADDDRARLAGRTALMVPMAVMIAAATVTSFLVVYKSEQLFATALAIWVVAGVVSLAAISGGVALIGRLAMIQAGERDDDNEDDSDQQEPSERSYMN